MRNVKDDFPILKNRDIVYLDNAATTQKPKSVIEAIKEFYEYHNANIHRGIYPLAREATEMYEGAHERVAKFIGGKMEETVFVRNASEGLNLAAWILKDRIGKGDKIITTMSEHHSNFLPWFKIARMRGARVDVIPTKEDGSIDEEKIIEAIDSRTKIVAVQHASNVTGYITDVKEIARAAHDNGAVIVVDGAQSVPHIPIDVKKLGIDALAFSAHKMLGPTGIGALWMKADLLEEGEPFLEGGDMIKEVHYNSELQVIYNDLPWKYEAGTPNIAGGVGFAAAVDYLERYGMENILPHEQKLAKRIMNGLEEMGVPFVGPRDIKRRGGVVAFSVPGKNPYTVALYLGTKNVCVRAGYHCAQPLHESLGIKGTVRASLYIYNDEEDVEKFLEALEGMP
ncbi:MAG: cysteine desulfurase / selenocysteine lyase [Candidatus Diapherotrites archaeon]|nr:cysteine desulfurase / selenocysteine lyase [Candidatus Diapherotrites archaeon]MDN5366716.1 cysteine desulfurase / selenocysteine lyase [Candidatus Diapherotrites archaeon]